MWAQYLTICQQIKDVVISEKQKIYGEMALGGKSIVVWDTISSCAGRPENIRSMPEHFLVDGRPVTDPGRIANCCNDLYTNIATNLNI